MGNESGLRESISKSLLQIVGLQISQVAIECRVFFINIVGSLVNKRVNIQLIWTYGAGCAYLGKKNYVRVQRVRLGARKDPRATEKQTTKPPMHKLRTFASYCKYLKNRMDSLIITVLRNKLYDFSLVSEITYSDHKLPT